MPYGVPRAARLVGVDDGVAVAGVRVGRPRPGRRAAARRSSVEQMDLHDDDDGVDGQLTQPGERAVHLVLRRYGDGSRVTRVALAPARRGDRVERADVAGGGEGEGDDAEGAELAAPERPRGTVGPVAQLRMAAEHLLPGLLVDSGEAVGHPGDGLVRRRPPTGPRRGCSAPGHRSQASVAPTSESARRVGGLRSRPGAIGRQQRSAGSTNLRTSNCIGGWAYASCDSTSCSSRSPTRGCAPAGRRRSTSCGPARRRSTRSRR